jgi:hypothetical protein
MTKFFFYLSIDMIMSMLAIAEVFASVLAGAILFGIWEWDNSPGNR